MMMPLWLTDEQAQAIVRHVSGEVPREACGLIAGRGGRVERIMPAPNAAADPLHFYEIDHKVLVQAMFEIERSGLMLMGIYHSHPNGDPIPSQTDIAQAAYPDVVYLIVGLRGGEPRLSGWHIRRHEVVPVTLHIGSSPPQAGPPELSKSHKAAILISVIVAFVFMIVLSLSLLPPAPKIP
jgi:proteasome lid subunit RPN8/RPN11